MSEVKTWEAMVSRKVWCESVSKWRAGREKSVDQSWLEIVKIELERFLFLLKLWRLNLEKWNLRMILRSVQNKDVNSQEGKNTNIFSNIFFKNVRKSERIFGWKWEKQIIDMTFWISITNSKLMLV